MTSVMVVECGPTPGTVVVPVTVIVYVPAATIAGCAILMVSTSVATPPAETVTHGVASVSVMPAEEGELVAERQTVPLKPPLLVTVIVEVTLDGCVLATM